MPEPACLSRGKAYHRLVADFYAYESSRFSSEQPIRRATLVGRPADFDQAQPWVYAAESAARGRIDGFLLLGDSACTVYEAKYSDLENMVRRGTLIANIHRHASQLGRYLEGIACWQNRELSRTGWLDLSRCDERYGAIVYPRRPPQSTMRVVERLLDERGVSTIWFDVLPPQGSLGREAFHAVRVSERLRAITG